MTFPDDWITSGSKVTKVVGVTPGDSLYDYHPRANSRPPYLMDSESDIDDDTRTYLKINVSSDNSASSGWHKKTVAILNEAKFYPKSDKLLISAPVEIKEGGIGEYTHVVLMIEYNQVNGKAEFTTHALWENRSSVQSATKTEPDTLSLLFRTTSYTWIR